MNQTPKASPGLIRTLAAAAVGIVLIGVPMTAGVAMVGCAWGEQAKFKATREVRVASVADMPLDVKTDNGDVVATKTAGGETVIVAKLRAVTQERLDAAAVRAERQPDGTLTIVVDWPEGKRRSNEGCDFEITIPSAMGLTLRTNNGNVESGGFAGPATLVTSNGDITVRGHDGPVAADSSNGAIVVEDVPTVKARTSNGDVTVRLSADGAGPVTATSSNGSITFTPGAAFVGTLDCDTSNGRITDATGAPTTGTPTRGHRTMRFGAGDASASTTSTLDTSNGSISITAKR